MDNITLDLKPMPDDLETSEGVLDAFLTEIKWEDGARGIKLPKEQEERVLIYPQFGDARFYRKAEVAIGVVVSVMGNKWRVAFTPRYSTQAPGEDIPAGGELTFHRVAPEEAETSWLEGDKGYDETMGWPKFEDEGYIVKLFGQPDFKQGDFPILMRATSHAIPVFIVFYDSWGDMGNWNLFVDFDEEGMPIACYYEANCG